MPRLSSSFHIYLHCQGSFLLQSLLKTSKTALPQNPETRRGLCATVVMDTLRKLIRSVLPYPVIICVFSMKTSIVVLHHIGRKQAKQGPFHFQWLAHRLSPKEVLICHLIKKKCGDYRSFCGNL